MKKLVLLFKNFPIRRKVNFAILLTCGTALAAAAAAIFTVQLATFRHSFNRDLDATGEMISQTITAAVTFQDHDGAAQILASLRAKPHILRASIDLPSGAEFAVYKTAKLDAAPAVPQTDGAHAVGPYLVLNRPVMLAGERIATLRLLCDYQTEYRRSLRLYAAILTGVLVVSALLALVLSSRLEHLISAPILSLADTAQTIAQKQDYSLRASKLFNDEVGELTGAFNQMLGRIQAQDHALARSRRKFEALVNSVEGIVWERDPETLDLTYVSRHCERLLGYAPDQWLAAPGFWKQHLHPEDADRAIRSCQDYINRRQSYTCEYRMIAADQRVVCLRESGSVLVEEDKLVAVRGILIDVTAQKEAAEQLERLNRQLIETSRLAGMSEVASGVLHNVGNVLNSVNVSANLINDQLRNSKGAALSKVCALLEENRAVLGPFFTDDPKGRRLLEFLPKLAQVQEDERQNLSRETQTLVGNIDHIKEIVAMQQNYANVAGATEDLPPAGIIEDAIRMNEGALVRHGVILKRDFTDVPSVRVDKHKVLQILVNLLRNAKYALDAANRNDKILTIALSRSAADRVNITVRDNGIGIPPENLTRIFGHGFTTKKNGHGFGLHSSANAAKEMGGSVQAFSDGPGTGAAFVLELPAAPPPAGREQLN